MAYLWSIGSINTGFIAWALIGRGAFITFSQPTCTAVIILTAASFAFGLVGLRSNTTSKILSVLERTIDFHGIRHRVPPSPL